MALYQGESSSSYRYCQIQHLFRHRVLINENGVNVSKTHTLAYVKWFVKSNYGLYYYNNQDPDRYNMELMQPSFEADSGHSIIPVSRLHSPVAVVLNHIDNSHVVVKLSRKVIF